MFKSSRLVGTCFLHIHFSNTGEKAQLTVRKPNAGITVQIELSTVEIAALIELLQQKEEAPK